MNWMFRLSPTAQWLVRHSVAAGLLVLFVLAVQWLLGRRLTGRWRFALWWIVLARLLLPFGPESAWSLFNYVPGQRAMVAMKAAPIGDRSEAGAAQNVPVELTVVDNPGPTASKHDSGTDGTTGTLMPGVTAQLAGSAGPDLMVVGETVWLGGALILGGCVLVQVLRFRRKLGGAAVVADQYICEVLDECRREFGITRPIDLIETRAVNAPALFGLFRLRLLLPQGLVAQFSRSEWRHIFLHELAHVKRGDLWLNWLVMALQLLHWFNPLIWLGFARLRADRELACDELALMHAGEMAGSSYGATVIKLLEGLSRPAAIPGLLGILEDRKQMRRRIVMIAGFRKASKWSAWAGVLLVGLAVVTLTDAQTKHGLDLAGVVHATDGTPLQATVFIYTAAPKVGTSTFCPSCYLDCRKNAKADAQGHFKIESLDPQLIFRVLVVCNGYRPQFVQNFDPAAGPMNARLQPSASDAVPAANIVRGRVVDSKGQPIYGAVVAPRGIREKNGGGLFGGVPGADPLAVTDENGEFMIASRDGFESLDMRVDARGFAPNRFNRLTGGSEVHQLALREGATVVGRVLYKGKPLKDVSVEIRTADDEITDDIKIRFNENVGTDAEGRFALLNVPPNVDYTLEGMMDTLRPYGAITSRRIHGRGDGETTDVGDLTVSPAYRLAGRVVLSDGAPVPANTRLLIAGQGGPTQITLKADGGFDIGGVPPGAVTLSVRVPGYRMSAKNASFDALNPGRMYGRVDEDVTGLVVLLERGDRLESHFDSTASEADWPQNRPLHGAEFAANHTDEWLVTGNVVDGESGAVIPHFRIMPGDSESTWGRMNWDPARESDGTGGSYQVYLQKRWAQPVIRADADGYLPQVMAVTPLLQTNVNFRLKPGAGPSGTVVLPNGSPAARANVVLICSDSQGVNIDYQKRLHAAYDSSQETVTDVNGHFSFKPELGMLVVAAATTDGFKTVPVESLATNSTILLQRYGKITGTLTRPTGPGTNEDLDVNILDDSLPLLARISGSMHSLTDASGHFEFDDVPPGQLQISYRVPMGRGWQAPPLVKVTLEPGETLQTNINAGARQLAEQPGGTPIPADEGPAAASAPPLKGIVLLPNGKPAAGAEVALKIQGDFIQLGRATFRAYQAREAGRVVNTTADGHFTLPGDARAQTVLALNDQGFVEVSVDRLKSSPEIKLRAWGRLEGVLQKHGQPDSGELLALSGNPWSGPPLLNWGDFEARTGGDGRFVITYIPPGDYYLSRMVSIGQGSSTGDRMQEVTIQEGAVARVILNRTGRTVIGKLVPANPNERLNWNAFGAAIQTPMLPQIESLSRIAATESPAAYAESASSAWKNYAATNLNFAVRLSDDGSFRAEDVKPGTYELMLDDSVMKPPKAPPKVMTVHVAIGAVVIPSEPDNGSDAPLDLGTIKIISRDFPVPPVLQMNADASKGI